jgi:hypothetical protein
MKRILRYLLGFVLIVIGSVLGLEAVEFFQSLLAAAGENDANVMRITGVEIIGYHFSIGPYTAVLFGVSVVLVWIGIRCIMPGHFVRRYPKS